MIIVDQRMPEMTGLEFLTRVTARFPNVQARKVVLTAHADADDIQAFVNSCGIFHYMTKPVKLPEITRIARAAVDAYSLTVENERLRGELERSNKTLQRENVALRKRVTSLSQTEPIIGEHGGMARAMQVIRQVAPTNTTIAQRTVPSRIRRPGEIRSL